jgi:hypothetical protein
LVEKLHKPIATNYDRSIPSPEDAAIAALLPSIRTLSRGIADMSDQAITVPGLFLGAGIAISSAFLTVLSRHFQDHLADRREQRKTLSLVRGEVANIKRHCEIVRSEVLRISNQNGDFGTILSWRKKKHGSLLYLSNNIARLGFVSEGSVVIVFEITMVIRNNDMEIDEIIRLIESGKLSERPILEDAVSRMLHRMDKAADLCDRLLSGL